MKPDSVNRNTPPGIEQDSGQTIQTTEGLICSIKLLLKPAKIDRRLWRQGRWHKSPDRLARGRRRDIAAEP